MDTTEELRQSLIDKTGLDFQKYQTEELSNSLAGSLTFPEQALKTIMTPPILLAFLFVIIAGVFFFLGMYLLGGIVAVLGLLSAPLTGLFWGGYRFSKILLKDVRGLLDSSVDIAEQAPKDIKELSRGKAVEANSLPEFPDILGGANSVVIIPTLSAIIKKKIPIVGGGVNKMVKGVIEKGQDGMLKALPAPSTDSAEKPEGEAATGKTSSVDKYCSQISGMTGLCRGSIDKVVGGLEISVVKPLGKLTALLIIGNLIAFAVLLFFALQG